MYLCVCVCVRACVCVWVRVCYEVNLLLFLFQSAFQKVRIAFLHTSITRQLPMNVDVHALSSMPGNDNLCFYRVQLLVLPYLW